MSIQLISVASGLLGVILGAVLTLLREVWFQKMKNQKDLEYLTVIVTCALDAYVLKCAEVVSDDGLCRGQPDENGYCTAQIVPPEFKPEELKVEWKSLSAELMYEVLDFPNVAVYAANKVRDT